MELTGINLLSFDQSALSVNSQTYAWILFVRPSQCSGGFATLPESFVAFKETVAVDSVIFNGGAS
jgi:hypothetical protein